LAAKDAMKPAGLVETLMKRATFIVSRWPNRTFLHLVFRLASRLTAVK
jgi:hypothetical protein